jgi:23S rRNA (guanosine2251-2'-O)-methyltransferase
VREALRAGRRRLDEILVTREAARRPEVGEILEAAGRLALPIRPVQSEELEGDEFGNSQGIALDAGPLPEISLGELAQLGESPRRIVALDGVEDPQNVGALARVAEGAGVCGMLLTDRRSPPLSPALARASAGAIEWLPVARVTNLVRAINSLKEKEFWVVGADLSAPDDLYQVDDRVLGGNLIVVMGAEGKGLRPEIQKAVDHPVRIPMGGRVASLNVATAGAVLLFELLRRERARNRD